MTRQEMFDKAVSALLKQGHRSATGHGQCLYRGLYGERCAVGHLLDGEALEFACSDGGIFRDVIDKAGGSQSRLFGHLAHELKFLSELQQAHDHPLTFEEGTAWHNSAYDSYQDKAKWLLHFKDAAKKLAAKYGLDDSVLKAA